MSAYHEIYLRPLIGSADPVGDLETLLGVNFDRTPVNNFFAHATIGREAVEVDDDMTLEDDLGVPFASHPWQITVRNFDRDAVAELTTAQRIFSALRDSGNYSLFLTVDGQKLIETAVRA
jgi:hypothetical protein